MYPERKRSFLFVGVLVVGMARGECYECGTDMEVAIWDDPALSGAFVLVCSECSEDVPEDKLWDVSNFDTEHPNLPSSNPLDDGSKWMIRNRYPDPEEPRIAPLRAPWKNKFPVDDSDEYKGKTFDDFWDIFVHDADDEDAVAEARAELRDRK